jgi:hypothetical protein
MKIVRVQLASEINKWQPLKIMGKVSTERERMRESKNTHKISSADMPPNKEDAEEDNVKVYEKDLEHSVKFLFQMKPISCSFN